MGLCLLNCFGVTEVEPKPKSTKRLLREKMTGDEDGKGKKSVLQLLGLSSYWIQISVN